MCRKLEYQTDGRTLKDVCNNDIVYNYCKDEKTMLYTASVGKIINDLSIILPYDKATRTSDIALIKLAKMLDSNKIVYGIKGTPSSFYNRGDLFEGLFKLLAFPCINIAYISIQGETDIKQNIKAKNEFQAILDAFGYDGEKFPQWCGYEIKFIASNKATPFKKDKLVKYTIVGMVDGIHLYTTESVKELYGIYEHIDHWISEDVTEIGFIPYNN